MPYEIGYGGVSKLPYLIWENMALNISGVKGCHMWIGANEKSYAGTRRQFTINDLTLITNPVCFTDLKAKAFIIRAIEECLK